MRKSFIYMVLLVFTCMNCQCRSGVDPRMIVFLKDNESQIEMLRGWCIDYHPERMCWECKHYFNKDSLLANVSVHMGRRNGVLSCNVVQLHEDSAIAVQMALRNINTLKDIKHIYGLKYIDADEVYNDESDADYVINMGNDTTLCQILFARNMIGSTNRHLYGKWYVRRHIDPDARIAAYIAENESQIRMLRGWDILYIQERECWWCKHWCGRDSLLSFVLVRVDSHDIIVSCDVGQLREDSVIAKQAALRNVSTLYDIKRFYGSKYIGSNEIELFNDTLGYIYNIGIGNDTTTYQIMLKNSNDISTDKHLYKNWYLRKNHKRLQ